MLVAAIALPYGVSADPDLDRRMADSANWATPAGDYANQRHSPLAQINVDNVNRLQVAWTFSTGSLRGHEGSPLVIGDVMYMHTPFPNRVYALNLQDQTIRWRYEPAQDSSVAAQMCCDVVNRGLAYGDGKIFLQQADTTLVALDARTGRLLWSVRNGDPAAGETNTNAPQVFGDKVLTGISGGEHGVRGRLSAYDIHTGKLVWKGYSAGPDTDMLIDPRRTLTWSNGAMTAVGRDSSLRSWPADQWRHGGTTWGWYAYDPKLNLVFYGSGRPGSGPAQRPGDNRWSSAIWARDLDTGVVRWVYQMTPHDEWGYDGVNEMVLLDLHRDGRTIPALAHFDHNGFAYTLNRATGELLVARRFEPQTNWATRVDPRSGRPVVDGRYSTAGAAAGVAVKGICPAAFGAKSTAPASYDPGSSLLYVPATHACMNYERPVAAAGASASSAAVTAFPAPDSHGGLGNFIAWDAGTGRSKWIRPERFSVWSGVLTTDGGIAFYGTLEGHLKAVRLQDGRELWKFKTPSGIVGNVFTYQYAGRQYVGVYSGVGGLPGLGLVAGLTDPAAASGAVGAFKDLAKHTNPGGAVFVFALPQT
ncbi:MAG TPA: PQQ-dependent dehydrogenase, methanol/ethanol family [Steroidobacteraceae bacterium]|nr:PQQ-dependent dehydrogenase, methanol/ethanol family [Steroidobacteraceae bacterium]